MPPFPPLMEITIPTFVKHSQFLWNKVFYNYVSVAPKSKKILGRGARGPFICYLK